MSEARLFCFSLRKGAVYAGHLTSAMSMIACGLALAIFFRESSTDDGDSKLVSFSIACYCMFYIVMSRTLIRGVKDNRRDKFICWIAMSSATVIILLSGVISVLIIFYTGGLENDLPMTLSVLGGAAACTITSGILAYCIWGVVTLWRVSRGGTNEVFLDPPA